MLNAGHVVNIGTVRKMTETLEAISVKHGQPLAQNAQSRVIIHPIVVSVFHATHGDIEIKCLDFARKTREMQKLAKLIQHIKQKIIRMTRPVFYMISFAQQDLSQEIKILTILVKNL